VDASPTPADDTANRPGPPPGRQAVGKLHPIGSLIDLVRKLKEYGRAVANALRQGEDANDPSRISRRFGTKDIGLILARITRGLLIATMLETKLIARMGREEPVQRADGTTPVTPSSAPAAPPRKPHATRPAPAEAQCVYEAPDPRIAGMPTAEEIAAEFRRRPVGAVLADIARDLGILPADPLWRELQLAIIHNGGCFVRLVRDVFKRARAWVDELPPEIREMRLVPPRPAAAARGTGPP
jgi:hypothetical protein